MSNDPDRRPVRFAFRAEDFPEIREPESHARVQSSDPLASMIYFGCGVVAVALLFSLGAIIVAVAVAVARAIAG